MYTNKYTYTQFIEKTRLILTPYIHLHPVTLINVMCIINEWMGRKISFMRYVEWTKETTAWPHCLIRITSNSPSVHPSSLTKTATHTLLLQFSVPVCPLWVSFQCLMFHLVRWQVGIILHYSSLS